MLLVPILQKRYWWGRHYLLFYRFTILLSSHPFCRKFIFLNVCCFLNSHVALPLTWKKCINFCLFVLWINDTQHFWPLLLNLTINGTMLQSQTWKNNKKYWQTLKKWWGGNIEWEIMRHHFFTWLKKTEPLYSNNLLHVWLPTWPPNLTSKRCLASQSCYPSIDQYQYLIFIYYHSGRPSDIMLLCMGHSSIVSIDVLFYYIFML